MKRRIVMIFFIAVTLIFSVGDYFFVVRESYDRYLSGEYYFREKAETIPMIAPEDFFSTIETAETVMAIDYTDTRNLLLYSNSQSVYAYGPHDGVCTVIYGSKTIEDFPVSNLRFEGDGEEYFYGRKQYSYDEYISYVKSLTKDQLESTRVSTPDVANFIDAQRFLFILIGVDTIFGIVLFVLYKQEMNGWFDIALLVCCLYSVFFEMITFFAFGR